MKIKSNKFVPFEQVPRRTLVSLTLQSENGTGKFSPGFCSNEVRGKG